MTSYDYSGLKCILLREEGCFCKCSWDACESHNSLSVSTKNPAGKVRIEMEQQFNHLITCPNWWLCECSSCFCTESPTYDDAKEPLNNWRSNLSTLCSLPDMLITFHAKSIQIICHCSLTMWVLWQSLAKTRMNLTESQMLHDHRAHHLDSFSWRCYGWTAANLSVSFNPASRLASILGYTSKTSSSVVAVLRPGGRNGGFRGVNGASRKVKSAKCWAEIIKSCLHMFTQFLPLKWLNLSRLDQLTRLDLLELPNLS